MNCMQDTATLNTQYKTADSLRLRIAFHQKYSLQTQPFHDWLFAHYAFFPGMRILEIGCGNGSLWQGKLETLPAPQEMILTDFSPGMVAEAKNALPSLPFLSFQTADIQSLPFRDEQFDMVIANMMLYHVPDLQKALSEVSRVLKKDGVFYCATSGEKTVVDYVREMLEGEEAPPPVSFTLQNGVSLLSPHFSKVDCLKREDALLVTDLSDLLSYIHSLACLSGLNTAGDEALLRRLEGRMEHGVLAIPKEYGTFRCVK